MIRKLIENDRADVLGFLSKEPSINLFIIGDIEAFGFDEEFQELWGQFSEDGELEGVLLRFNENFIPYFIKSDFDITEFKNIILNNTGKTMVSGKESIVKSFQGVLPNRTARTTYFCELTDQNKLDSTEKIEEIKIAQESDAQRIYNLIESIDEFTGIGNSIERIEQRIKTKTGRIYYIENEDGMMVSIAQTTAENSKSAMVVGVATLKEYRGRGLVSKCLSKLCNDVMLESKSLCLFYDNPKAGSIYHRLGFKSIDNWMMITE